MSLLEEKPRFSGFLELEASNQPLLPGSKTLRRRGHTVRHHLYRLLPYVLALLATTNIVTLAFVFAKHPCPSSSPIYPKLEGVDETYRWTQFTSTLFSQSQYVARPSPEVDSLWKDLGAEIDDILIPAHYGKAADVSPGHAFVEFEPGNPSFVVSVEAFHQLHCLNLLRKSLFYNADYYKGLGVKEFRNHGTMLQMHIDHCLDMLRERLMCTADAGILPSFYTIYNTTTPDFKRDHHCRDYGSLQAWGRAAKALPKGMVLSPPEGAFVLEHVP
ncbi:hypothetical protein B0T25DRAFT_530902 [Lasiosphaeria hispida]|uniref:Tat pathway signal sequence n=1 Tax=Lasiosphaeria hispida TaxID=260671 RepID=A0AAJ0HPA7_9PEZI|nr:hypothetical protein B0T25DRAFT_530902 [Lasiosphaeria hispida]